MRKELLEILIPTSNIFPDPRRRATSYIVITVRCIEEAANGCAIGRNKMHSMRFDKPVSVTVGLNGTLEIHSLMDMHRFLTDWPPTRRTSVYETAVRACQAAHQGHLTADQARRAFVEFAKLHDILWPDMDSVIADAAKRSRRTYI